MKPSHLKCFKSAARASLFGVMLFALPAFALPAFAHAAKPAKESVELVCYPKQSWSPEFVKVEVLVRGKKQKRTARVSLYIAAKGVLRSYDSPVKILTDDIQTLVGYKGRNLLIQAAEYEDLILDDPYGENEPPDWAEQPPTYNLTYKRRGKTYTAGLDCYEPGDSPDGFCGDGLCQNASCLAIGCPEPESAVRCPIDCDVPKAE